MEGWGYGWRTAAPGTAGASVPAFPFTFAAACTEPSSPPPRGKFTVQQPNGRASRPRQAAKRRDRRAAVKWPREWTRIDAKWGSKRVDEACRLSLREGVEWVLHANTLSPHFVSTLCRLRFVPALCPYALSKAKDGVAGSVSDSCFAHSSGCCSPLSQCKPDTGRILPQVEHSPNNHRVLFQGVVDGVGKASLRFHYTRPSCGRASKCASREKSRRLCCCTRAAIQMSLVGIGVPCSRNCRKMRA